MVEQLGGGANLSRAGRVADPASCGPRRGRPHDCGAPAPRPEWRRLSPRSQAAEDKDWLIAFAAAACDGRGLCRGQKSVAAWRGRPLLRAGVACRFSRVPRRLWGASCAQTARGSRWGLRQALSAGRRDRPPPIFWGLRSVSGLSAGPSASSRDRAGANSKVTVWALASLTAWRNARAGISTASAISARTASRRAVQGPRGVAADMGLV